MRRRAFSSSIARCPVRRLRASGWTVYAVARREERLAELAEQTGAISAPTDVTDQAQVDALAEAATKIVADHGGTVVKTETWGLKSLAYNIERNRKAHFVLLNIDAPSAAVAEMERQMQISEDVLRFMTIRVEELEQEAAVESPADEDPRKKGE